MFIKKNGILSSPIQILIFRSVKARVLQGLGERALKCNDARHGLHNGTRYSRISNARRTFHTPTSLRCDAIDGLNRGGAILPG